MTIPCYDKRNNNYNNFQPFSCIPIEINNLVNDKKLQNQCARILTKSPRREHITPVLMKLHRLKIQDRIIYKMLMLTYKSYYNMAPALFM